MRKTCYGFPLTGQCRAGAWLTPRWQHEFACVLYARLPQVSMCRPLKTALEIADQLQ
jgi:hypothetical protein